MASIMSAKLKVNRQLSPAPAAQCLLVEALIENFPSQELLMAACESLWPDCEFYIGHTHLRIFPGGKGTDSIYVETV